MQRISARHQTVLIIFLFYTLTHPFSVQKKHSNLLKTQQPAVNPILPKELILVMFSSNVIYWLRLLTEPFVFISPQTKSVDILKKQKNALHNLVFCLPYFEIKQQKTIIQDIAYRLLTLRQRDVLSQLYHEVIDYKKRNTISCIEALIRIHKKRIAQRTSTDKLYPDHYLYPYTIASDAYLNFNHYSTPQMNSVTIESRGSMKRGFPHSFTGFASPIMHLDHQKLLREYMSLLSCAYKNINDIQLLATSCIGLHFSIINFSHNNIPKISVSSLQGMAELQTFLIDYNNIRHIDDTAFISCIALKHINLNRNQLSTIGTQFAHLQKLETLSLAHNCIDIVDPHAFEKCTSLQELNLSNNQLIHIHQFLVPAINLTKLMINNNKIRTITKDDVSNCKHLEYISLFRNNPLLIIDAQAFDHQLSLKAIHADEYTLTEALKHAITAVYRTKPVFFHAYKTESTGYDKSDESS